MAGKWKTYISKTMIFMFLLCFISPGLMSFIGCGGGGDDGGRVGGNGGGADSTFRIGSFIDKEVENLRFVCGTVSDYTDEQGTFIFDDLHDVSFYIGDILIGTSVGKSVVTPIDLVPSAADGTHPKVINICRFLQTLDEDQDPFNGITIPEEVTSAATGVSGSIDFLSEGDVEYWVQTLTHDLPGGARNLVSAQAAEIHMRCSILELVEHYYGIYTGTYDGNETGNFSIAVDIFGHITGISLNDNPDDFCEGMVNYDGVSTFSTGSGTPGDKTFSGMIGNDFTFTGTWEDGNGNGGTFTAAPGSFEPTGSYWDHNEYVMMYNSTFALTSPQWGRSWERGIFDWFATEFEIKGLFEGPPMLTCEAIDVTIGWLQQGILQKDDPLRVTPLSSTQELTTEGRIDGIYVPTIDNNEYVTALVHLDFLGSVWEGVDISAFNSDLTLSMVDESGTVYGEPHIICSAENLRELDTTKSYIFIDRTPFETSDFDILEPDNHKLITLKARVDWGSSDTFEDSTVIDVPPDD